MRQRLGAFLAAATLLGSSASFAATRYVATTGNDGTGNGTSASPWRTIQKCAGTMAPGDTCSVAAGNYDEGVSIKVGGPDAARPSAFVSTGGRAVARYFLFQASHVLVEGFEVTQPLGADYYALTFSRINATTGITDITVQGCYIHDTVWGAYAISPYLDIPPTHVTLRNNTVRSVWGPAMIVSGSYWTIEGNTFSDIHSDVAYYGGDHHVVQDNTFKLVFEGDEGHHADFFQNIATTGVSTLTDFLVQRNKIMYGGGVQIGNFNNDAACPGNNLTWRNNVIYAVTNPFNYSGCNSFWFNNTFVFAAMNTAANPVTSTTAQLTDHITFQNNLFVGNSKEGDTTRGGSYDPGFSNLTEGNNMVTAWPSSSFAPMAGFNTSNGNINGGDPGFANLPISAYPAMGFGETGWDFEISSRPGFYIDNAAWAPGPGTGIDGAMWYSPGNVGWTYNGAWAYASGGGDWTQYYAAHASDGTAPLVYDNFTPVVGRTYAVAMRPHNNTIIGSLTPSLGGQSGTPCTSANIDMSGWCPLSYLKASSAGKLTFTPSNDFRDGLWQTSVWWSPGTDEYDISTTEKHGGKNSLHLSNFAAGSTVTSGTQAGFVPAHFGLEAWVKLVSGGIKLYVVDANRVVSPIDSTTQTGTWVRLSGEFVHSTAAASFVFESTAPGTEVFIDDVHAHLLGMSTTTIQYPAPQEAALVVGASVSINGDGVCRTITAKDAARHVITFTPPLSTAASDDLWVEAWLDGTNCVVDLSLTDASTGPRGHGANLSAAGFSDDLTKATRSSWDIGAYAYRSAGPTFTVGGVLVGLGAGGMVTVQNNGSDPLNLSSDGAFTFPTALNGGAAYLVSVSGQPAGQSCSVSNGAGVVAQANVTNVLVTCLPLPADAGQPQPDAALADAAASTPDAAPADAALADAAAPTPDAASADAALADAAAPTPDAAPADAALADAAAPTPDAAPADAALADAAASTPDTAPARDASSDVLDASAIASDAALSALDTGPSETDAGANPDITSGCGCSAGAQPSGVGLFFLLALAARRKARAMPWPR
ncbi:MAG: hypothetical protein QM765_22355 [Myxococcales bacterium]